MADMLLRGPRKSWGNCTCPDCIMGSRRDARRANRPADKRAWQQEVDAGDYGTEPHVPDLSGGNAGHAWGSLADYMNTPAEQREPHVPYWELHDRPMTLKTVESIESFKVRMAERVKHIRGQRDSRSRNTEVE